MGFPVNVEIRLREQGVVGGNAVHGGVVELPESEALKVRRARVADAFRAFAEYVAEGRADDVLSGGEQTGAGGAGGPIGPL